MKRLAGFSIVTVYVSLIAMPALAYIDPGTGTFLLQVLAAAAFGMLYFLRQLRERIKQMFVRIFRIGKKLAPHDQKQ